MSLDTSLPCLREGLRCPSWMALPMEWNSCLVSPRISERASSSFAVIVDISESANDSTFGGVICISSSLSRSSCMEDWACWMVVMGGVDLRRVDFGFDFLLFCSFWLESLLGGDLVLWCRNCTSFCDERVVADADRETSGWIRLWKRARLGWLWAACSSHDSNTLFGRTVRCILIVVVLDMISSSSVILMWRGDPEVDVKVATRLMHSLTAVRECSVADVSSSKREFWSWHWCSRASPSSGGASRSADSTFYTLLVYTVVELNTRQRLKKLYM